MSVNDHQELYPMISRKPFFLVKQFSLKCLGMISDILLPNQSLKGTAGLGFFFFTILNPSVMVYYDFILFYFQINIYRCECTTYENLSRVSAVADSSGGKFFSTYKGALLFMGLKRIKYNFDFVTNITEKCTLLGKLLEYGKRIRLSISLPN